MLIYPAIDLFEGKAVRLYKGDYAQMTVYSDHPEQVALDFAQNGATHIHLVDLEGAKSGQTPNIDTVMLIKNTTGLFCEIGGGIRSMEVIDRYISAGVEKQSKNMVIKSPSVLTSKTVLSPSRVGRKLRISTPLPSVKKCRISGLKPSFVPIFPKTAPCKAPTTPCIVTFPKNFGWTSSLRAVFPI